VTSACRAFKIVNSMHLCGDTSPGHTVLGARREPVRGAAQGEPGRTRKGQPADDDGAVS
jgi:hypothetical protein